MNRPEFPGGSIAWRRWGHGTTEQVFESEEVEAGIELSVGSVGDSYDNAMAESIIDLFKTEVIRRRGPWRNIDAVEIAVLERVYWFNNKRLLEPLGYMPPAEFEQTYHQQNNTAAETAFN